jgi:hypothetical protein
MTTLSYYMDTDCITVREQTNENLLHLQSLGNIQCSTKAKMIEYFCCRRIYLKYCSVAQYLISKISDFVTRKWKWYTTSHYQWTTIVMSHFRKRSSEFSVHSDGVSCEQTGRWRPERKLSTLHTGIPLFMKAIPSTKTVHNVKIHKP